PQDPAMEQYVSRIMELAGTIRRQIVFTRDYQDMGVKSPEWQHLETVVRRATTPTPFEHIRFQVSTGSLEVFADPMLEKAIFNLMENSERHGKTATEVRISFHEEGGRGVIVFEDNGVGVPPESKGQIFEWAHGKNTGFGLFLVREILSITGMTIRETGEAGKGARFEIEVPKEHYRMARDLG
ncbi:MAG: sensor histidine kinase, partial [Methanotrichaceae archaeon]